MLIVSSIGKQVGLRRYFHIEALVLAPEECRYLVNIARDMSKIHENDYNVIRVDLYHSRVSFLSYPDFFEDPFPALHLSISVDVNRQTTGRRCYSDSLNPPILHRKELLLPTNHPERARFEQLTKELENLGLLNGIPTIGFRQQWQEAIFRAGYHMEGHTLVPMGNDILTGSHA
jgi:DNA phosphorothioation-associated putative methyltransferase